LWAARALQAPGQGWLRLAVALAMVCVAASFSLDAAAHMQAALSPRSSAWSATVAALLGWQGLHALILLLMGGYVLARSFSGRLTPRARATFDNTALMWHYVSAQGLAMAALVQGLPGLLAP
jgi:cytochrome c oxidase subunit I+III